MWGINIELKKMLKSERMNFKKRRNSQPTCVLSKPTSGMCTMQGRAGALDTKSPVHSSQRVLTNRALTNITHKGCKVTF